MAEPCEHFNGVGAVEPQSRGCQECLALREPWTELRVCLTCGHVGCCEDSKHAHALQHYNATGHPLIASLERGQNWAWCYVDRRYFDPMPIARPRRRSWLAALLQRRTTTRPG